ncbi:MAG: F0F1 ATP synthase subunit A [Phycisphaerae bacterium]
MLLAAQEIDIVRKITDHPWHGFEVELFGIKFVWMSSGIAAMLLTAMAIIALILPAARRYKAVPCGGRNAVEILVLFGREMIAKPALHGRADKFLPFLLTVFVFVLGMNLAGMLPLEPITAAIGDYVPALRGKEIGGTPTSILTVCAALAAMTLLMVIAASLRTQAHSLHHRRKWPMALCAILSPVVWLMHISPPIPGLVGVILKVPMTVIEIVGLLARCGALMIRLFANMISGHALLAVMLMLIFQALAGYLRSSSWHVFVVGPLCILASVAVNLLELLVAIVQAYVFTFLSAIFIGLAMEESH